eukprot:2241762-Rhodomonas_salina.3
MACSSQEFTPPGDAFTAVWRVLSTRPTLACKVHRLCHWCLVSDGCSRWDRWRQTGRATRHCRNVSDPVNVGVGSGQLVCCRGLASAKSVCVLLEAGPGSPRVANLAGDVALHLACLFAGDDDAACKVSRRETDFCFYGWLQSGDADQGSAQHACQPEQGAPQHR